jgi:hypothetical protein
MMARIRFLSALLSLISLAIALWTWSVQGDIRLSATLFLAAVVLAIMSPFDASDRRRRRFVLFACVLYTAAIFVAIVSAYSVAAPSFMMIALVAMLDVGVGLSCWAFATRNRRRIPESRSYYDN